MLNNACKKNLQGTENQNLAPNTHTIIDTIIRSGSLRYPSQVAISWWADDPDGFIAGYEYAFGKTLPAASKWKFISKKDSVFALTTPAGSDTADFVFWVRAIDNLGSKDPSPAFVKYPVKNTAPIIAFVNGIYNPTKVFPVVKLLWQANDDDGSDNINYLEAVWNDTTAKAIRLSSSASSAIFEATQLSANITPCKVFVNGSVTALDSTIKNMKLNASNNLFIRAVDRSAAKSKWMASYTIFIKKVISPVLVVDAYQGNNSPMSYYGQRLTNNGIINYDSIRLFENIAGNKSQQSENQVQEKIFKLFTHIIWFGDVIETSLVTAEKTTGAFFNKNGKMFMAVKLQSLFDEQSSFFGFTPASKIVSYIDTTLILAIDSLVKPDVAGWPILKSTNNISPIKPFLLIAGATSLYQGVLQAKEGAPLSTPPYPRFTGNSTVMAKKTNTTNGQTNFIFSEVELQNVNGNSNADQLWGKILNELGL
jgi:hypothetical protein